MEEEIIGIKRKWISKEEAKEMFPEKETIENRLQRMEMILSCYMGDFKKQEEMLETILHAICKNDDQKTVNAIRKYLGSGYRNNRGMY